MKKQLFLTSLVLCNFCVALIGCRATAPMPSGTVFSPVTQLHPLKNSNLYFHLYDEATTKSQAIKVIQVEPVEINAEAMNPVQASAIRLEKTFFEERVYYNLVRTLSPKVMICRPQTSLKEYVGLGYPIGKVRVTVVDFNRGNGWLRYLGGFFGSFGLGGVVLQVEGSFVDADNNTKIADFLFRIRYSGNQIFGPNPRVISSTRAVREALDFAGEDVASLLKMLIIPQQHGK